MKKVLQGRVPVKIWTNDVEAEAETQLLNVSGLPFIHKHVAVMPDVHAGKGSTIGTVIATKGAIIPSCVGVDIGCGMCAVKLPVKIDSFDKLVQLRASIERSVPVGHNSNRNTTERVDKTIDSLGFPTVIPSSMVKIASQVGTLGGGNHFIEICQDQNNDAWVMLHSGSRNIGKVLADIHINGAKDLMKKYFIDLADKDLAYLVQNTPEFESYIHDLHWAQNYAKANRNEMMLRVLKDISYHLYKEDRGADSLTSLRVDCHHNYTQMEHHFGENVWITRKGAVSAKAGELGIIPGSMGAKSFIVEGLGNPESFHSCSHGAGRAMSRTKAKSLFTKEDLAKQTEGVECRKDADAVDEIPSAYKNIDEVMANQADLVKPLYTLKQILCVKG
jgi:tRNA-splicing ligase RtcB